MEPSTLRTESSHSNVQTLGWIQDNPAGIVRDPSSSVVECSRSGVLLFTFGSTETSDDKQGLCLDDGLIS